MQNKAKVALNHSKNSTCRAMGHDFKNTTSDTYRVCSRSHCGAAQRLNNGQWIDVEQVARKAEKELQALPVVTMFDWIKEAQA